MRIRAEPPGVEGSPAARPEPRVVLEVADTVAGWQFPDPLTVDLIAARHLRARRSARGSMGLRSFHAGTHGRWARRRDRGRLGSMQPGTMSRKAKGRVAAPPRLAGAAQEVSTQVARLPDVISQAHW